MEESKKKTTALNREEYREQVKNQVTEMHRYLDAIDVEELNDEYFVKYCKAYAEMMAWELFTERVLPVVLVDNEAVFTATNGLRIEYNPHSELLNEAQNKTDKFRMLKGGIYHEIGHLFYSNLRNDFGWKKKIKELSFQQPELQDIQKKMAEHNGFHRFCTDKLGNLENCIEDVYMEQRMCREKPSKYIGDMLFLRDIIVKRWAAEQEPVKSHVGTFSNFFTLAINGYDGEYTAAKNIEPQRIAEAQQYVKIAKPIFDRYMHTDDLLGRSKLIEELFIVLLPLFNLDFERHMARQAQKKVEKQAVLVQKSQAE